MSILSTHVLGNSLLTWLIALSVALVSFTILRVLRGFLSRRLSALAASTSARPVEMMVGLIGRTRSYFLLILALYAGSLLLTLSATAMRVIDKIVILALLLQIGLWVTDLLGRWLEHYREDRLETDPNSVTTLYTIGFLGRFVLWSVLLLLALANV
ncbi:MAG TPA: hypothetical protein VF171_01315, partial [Trueperaceae bacterium]